MKYQLSLLAMDNERINAEHNEKIKAFIDEYESHTTSNLAEVEFNSMIWELRNRGFTGIIHDTSHGGDYNLQKTDWNHD